MEEHHSFDIKRIVKFFTKEEVKTPLAFFFKVVPYLVAAWLAILYAPVSDGMKFSMFVISSLILLGLCVVVGVMAWFRPKHLVYGESGHRAEHKLEFGSEQQIIDEETLNLLEKVQNPKLLKEGSE
ncbi:MAG TPA: hypothetical protein VNY24_19500 [Candidatus Acidoferrales bacterium]|jgi:hypothetical protein|nr:hypothetical protein [Candidatus Acidoferrales bacterium]